MYRVMSCVAGCQPYLVMWLMTHRQPLVSYLTGVQRLVICSQINSIAEWRSLVTRRVWLLPMRLLRVMSSLLILWSTSSMPIFLCVSSGIHSLTAMWVISTSSLLCLPPRQHASMASLVWRQSRSHHSTLRGMNNSQC